MRWVSVSVWLRVLVVLYEGLDRSIDRVASYLSSLSNFSVMLSFSVSVCLPLTCLLPSQMPERVLLCAFAFAIPFSSFSSSHSLQGLC